MGELTFNARPQWRAKPPRGEMRARDWTAIRELFLHWPGEPSRPSYRQLGSRTACAGALRAWQAAHFANGWSDIAYSIVLFQQWGTLSLRDALWVGRGVGFDPAGQERHNRGTIALLVVLGPDDPILPSTVRRLKSFKRWSDEHAGRQLAVRPHSAVVATQCPGPALRALAPRLELVR